MDEWRPAVCDRMANDAILVRLRVQAQGSKMAAGSGAWAEARGVVGAAARGPSK
jgi:hypothetical protein